MGWYAPENLSRPKAPLALILSEAVRASWDGARRRAGQDGELNSGLAFDASSPSFRPPTMAAVPVNSLAVIACARLRLDGLNGQPARG